MRIFSLSVLFFMFFTFSAAAQLYSGDLKPGETFTLSKGAPLVNDINPADLMEAISNMRSLPPGTEIYIIKVSFQDSDPGKHRPWYLVKVTNPSNIKGIKGWINGTALIGQ